MVNGDSVLGHYSREAERAVIGSVIEDSSIIPSVLDYLSIDDFYFESHRHILRTIVKLQGAGTPVDLILLVDDLEQTGTLESIGGAHLFLSEIIDTTPSSALVENYCTLIKEKAIIRRVIEASQKIIRKAGEITSGNVDDLLGFAQQVILASTITDNPTNPDLRELVKEAFSRIEERYNSGGALPGIASGFESLDALLGGFKNGCFYVVAGRPGTGKTALALNTARTAAGAGKNVAFFSLEMPAQELTNRLLSAEAGVDGHKISRGYLLDNDLAKIAQASDVVARLPLYIDDTSSLAINRIATRARRIKAERGLDMIFVDYVQLVAPSHRWNTREQEVSEVSRSLKALAKELNVPVIAGAQLNRAIETRVEKKPTLADLRESGAIEQDSDGVFFLAPIDFQGLTELIVAKHRQGPTGSVNLFFDKKITRFRVGS